MKTMHFASAEDISNGDRAAAKSGVQVQFVVSSSISDETFAEDAAEFNSL